MRQNHTRVHYFTRSRPWRPKIGQLARQVLGPGRARVCGVTDILHILFGALLVSVGVLASALADRIRGIRLVRERAPREPKVEVAKLKGATPARFMTTATDALRRDVVLALTTMGYGKIEASEAVDACAGSECGTIESWTRAALKRAFKEAA